jgi:hypothetical protein
MTLEGTRRRWEDNVIVLKKFIGRAWTGLIWLRIGNGLLVL